MKILKKTTILEKKEKVFEFNFNFSNYASLMSCSDRIYSPYPLVLLLTVD
jgi:hypothetical protein